MDRRKIWFVGVGRISARWVWLWILKSSTYIKGANYFSDGFGWGNKYYYGAGYWRWWLYHKTVQTGVLVSRINALLRRANSFQAADTELQSNGIKVLLLQGQVFKNGELLDLTAAEYKLLCLFMRNPSMVLTKGQILDKLWDCDGNYIDSSTLTVYMRRLRMKIEDNPSEPQMLLTVRGMGYKWNIIGWGAEWRYWQIKKSKIYFFRFHWFWGLHFS